MRKKNEQILGSNRYVNIPVVKRVIRILRVVNQVAFECRRQQEVDSLEAHGKQILKWLASTPEVPT